MHGHVVFAELWHCCFGVFQIIKSYQIRDFGGRVSCVRKSNHGYFNCTFMDDYSNQYLWNELQQLLDENTQGHGWDFPSSRVKSLDILNIPFGNGLYKIYKNCDLGDGLWHCFTQSIPLQQIREQWAWWDTLAVVQVLSDIQSFQGRLPPRFSSGDWQPHHQSRKRKKRWHDESRWSSHNENHFETHQEWVWKNLQNSAFKKGLTCHISSPRLHHKTWWY